MTETPFLRGIEKAPDRRWPRRLDEKGVVC
jgi:hypothetical protein